MGADRAAVAEEAAPVSVSGSQSRSMTAACGIPLARTLTGGNRNDITQLLELLERVPPVRGRVGRPRHRPRTLIADRGYDHDKYRRLGTTSLSMRCDHLARRLSRHPRLPPLWQRRARNGPTGLRVHSRSGVPASPDRVRRSGVAGRTLNSACCDGSAPPVRRISCWEAGSARSSGISPAQARHV